MSFLIRPVQASLTQDTSPLKHMDPFCVVKLGHQTQRTKVHEDGGRRPQWNDTLTFKYTDDKYLKVEVWDKDFASDELAGMGGLALTKAFNNPNVKVNEVVDLGLQGRKVGRLILVVEYQSNMYAQQSAETAEKVKATANQTQQQQQGLNPLKMDITALVQIVTGKMNYPGFDDPTTPPTSSQKNYPEFGETSIKLPNATAAAGFGHNYPGFDNTNTHAIKGNQQNTYQRCKTEDAAINQNAGKRDYQAMWENTQQVTYPHLEIDNQEKRKSEQLGFHQGVSYPEIPANQNKAVNPQNNYPDMPNQYAKIPNPQNNYPEMQNNYAKTSNPQNNYPQIPQANNYAKIPNPQNNYLDTPINNYAKVPNPQNNYPEIPQNNYVKSPQNNYVDSQQNQPNNYAKVPNQHNKYAQVPPKSPRKQAIQTNVTPTPKHNNYFQNYQAQKQYQNYGYQQGGHNKATDPYKQNTYEKPIQNPLNAVNPQNMPQAPKPPKPYSQNVPYPQNTAANQYYGQYAGYTNQQYGQQQQQHARSQSGDHKGQYQPAQQQPQYQQTANNFYNPKQAYGYRNQY